jgi:hypothetical protein
MYGLMQLQATFKKLMRGGERRIPPSAPVRTISPWERAAMKYDLSRMTETGLRPLAEDLFAAGAISRADLMLLSCDPDTWAAHWPARGSGSCRDWMDEVETRLRQGHPDYTYLAHEQRLLTLLGRVEAVRVAMLPAPAEQPLPATAAPAGHPVLEPAGALAT